MRNITLALTTALSLLVATASYAQDGWVTKTSPHSVTQTADNLVAAINKAGATLFARIDHQAGAKKVGLEMAPATLVIFGNPKIGTPIMNSNMKAGLDLPIRVLIWSEDGKTQMGALSAGTIKSRYSIEGAEKPLKMMQGALGKLMGAAAK
ncbi:MAG: DUF302 domain-containing protein [Rhizobiaceae bacterium]